jgi:hypothetical protein
MYAEKLEELQYTKRLNRESKKLNFRLGNENESNCLCSSVAEIREQCFETHVQWWCRQSHRLSHSVFYLVLINIS